MFHFSADTPYTRVTLDKTDVSHGSTDFGIVDQKGRKIGYVWTIQSVKATELPADFKGSCYCLPVGHPHDYFEVRTQPTRNGRGYGPAFNRAQAVTLAEIEVIIRKRTEAARKTNTKKFARAA